MMKRGIFANRTLLILGTTVVIVFVALYSRISSYYNLADDAHFPTHAITFGHIWRLEIAHTDALRMLGLGERESLPRDRGMLFLFDQPDRYGFWMEGMQFPLDIIFLSHGRIVFIERGIQPGDSKIVVPPTPVDQVLEVNAGEAATLEPGDRIRYWRSF